VVCWVLQEPDAEDRFRSVKAFGGKEEEAELGRASHKTIRYVEQSVCQPNEKLQSKDGPIEESHPTRKLAGVLYLCH
jgi:hypothetical protein